jgi:hypothetical protein
LLNSATLKQLLINTAIVATANANKNALNFAACVMVFGTVLERLAASAKSMHSPMKRRREATWKDRPATMICVPVCSTESVLASEAMPPPIACSTREKKSQEMKRMVYVRGEKRDREGP